MEKPEEPRFAVPTLGFQSCHNAFCFVGNTPKKSASIQLFFGFRNFRSPFLFGDPYQQSLSLTCRWLASKKTEQSKDPLAVTYPCYVFFLGGVTTLIPRRSLTEVATVSATSWVWRRSLIRPCLVMALQPNTGRAAGGASGGCPMKCGRKTPKPWSFSSLGTSTILMSDVWGNRRDPGTV